MKFCNKHFQNYRQSVEKHLKDIRTQTDWVYDSNGGFISPHGFGVYATYDPDAGIVRLWASKNKKFLLDESGQGKRLSEQSAKGAYLVDVLPIEEKDSLDLHRLVEKCKKFDDDLPGRSAHTLYFGVTYADNPLEFNDPSGVSYGQGQSVLFNAKGSNVYLHDLKAGEVKRYQSIYRKDGSFKPVQFSCNFLRYGFTYRSKTISNKTISDDFAKTSACADTDESRRYVSRLYWEESKKLAKGFPDKELTALAELYNGMHSLGAVRIVSLLPVATYFASFQPYFTATAVLSGFFLAAHHEQVTCFFEDIVDSSRKVVSKIAYKTGFNRVANKLNPHISYEKNLKDSESILTKESKKLGSKANREACLPENNHMLPQNYVNKTASLLRAKKVSVEDHDALESFLAQIHQLNIPGVLVEPDKHTIGAAYDNGVRMVRYKNPSTGRIKILAQFDDDIVYNELLDLPDHYKEQFAGKNIVFDCCVEEGKFHYLRSDNVSRLDLLDTVNKELLFKHQAYMPQEVKDQSFKCIESVFPYKSQVPYEGYCFSNKIDPEEKRVPIRVFPFVEATMTDQELKDRGLIPEACPNEMQPA